MMEFKLTHEDGDYQVFHSTNHSDPDRIGTIVADHALCGSAQYAAFVEDQERECVDFDQMMFFDEWDKAQRYLESICTMRVRISELDRRVGKRISELTGDRVGSQSDRT